MLESYSKVKLVFDISLPSEQFVKATILNVIIVKTILIFLSLICRLWFWSQGLIRPLPCIKPSRKVWTTCGRYLPSSSIHEPFLFAMKMRRWNSGSKLWSILKVRDWALCCLRGKSLTHVDGKLLFCGSRFFEEQRTGKLTK